MKEKKQKTIFNFYIEGNISLPYKKLTKNYLKISLNKICSHIDLKNISLSVILCDNKYIHKINKEYRKKDKPTDVISFSYRENPFPEIEFIPEPLGDIYISLEKAEGDAFNYGIDFLDEVRKLLIHGVLHLIGYDHERSKEDEKIMKDKEDEIYLAL